MLGLAFLLSSCSATEELPAGGAPLDPIAFFTGPTRGQGRLDPIVGKSAAVSVRSDGVRQGARLRLTQRIVEGDKPERVRVWTMQPAGIGRFTGSLTDAAGPATLTVRGSRAIVAYSTPSGLRIRQQLALQPDGRTILNRLDAFKFGLRVATLHETIRKPLAK